MTLGDYTSIPDEVNRRYDREECQQRALSEAGNADRLIDLHGRDLTYVPGIGWFVWRENRWERDPGGELIRRARHTIATIRLQAAETRDESWRNILTTHARRSESERALAAMVDLAQADERVETMPDRLDSNPWALNTPGGIIDVRAGTLRAHARRDSIPA